MGYHEVMAHGDTASVMRKALLLALVVAHGGCVFDSMGIPSSTPPAKDAVSSEKQHDQRLTDLGPLELGPLDLGPPDLPLSDLPPPGDGKPDKILVVKDAPQPKDTTVKPLDQGCPSGKSLCGSKCVDLNKDVKNCGKCSKVCDSKAADGCQSGQCVCGTSGVECVAGLNCQKGKCQCISGGGSRCTGCCQNNTCYPPGTTGGQSAKRCGAKGNTCQSCDDSKFCTFDGCSIAGACYHANQPSTMTCDDNDICTSADKCSVGVCKGTTKDCTSLDGPCNTGVCNSSLFGICEQKAKPNNTPCQLTAGPCTDKTKCWCLSGMCMVK